MSYTPESFAAADAGASFLTFQLIHHTPFFFLRFGDGFLECVAGRSGMTCDFEPYSTFLAGDLMNAWWKIIGYDRLVLGDWQTAAFTAADEHTRYRQQYENMIEPHSPARIHFESLLLMRESTLLVDFYRAVRKDARRKLFMGPEENRGAAKMMGADFLPIPLTNLHEARWDVYDALCARNFDVLLYGAGMAGNIPVIDYWSENRDKTYVNLGSAMDPLFRGKSRRQQLPTDTLRRMFADLL